jgi:hypothetical protein
MIAREDAPGTGSRPLHRARRFYGIAGVLAVAAGIMNFWAPFEGWLRGCAIFISQEAMDAGFDGEAVELPGGCAYYLDVIGIVVQLGVGTVLLLGAWRYFRTDRASTIATALAIPAGLLIGAVPAYTVWWLFDFYRLSIGPTEVLFMAVAAAVLAWAVVSGWRTVRHLLDRSATPR